MLRTAVPAPTTAIRPFRGDRRPGPVIIAGRRPTPGATAAGTARPRPAVPAGDR